MSNQGINLQSCLRATSILHDAQKAGDDIPQVASTMNADAVQPLKDFLAAVQASSELTDDEYDSIFVENDAVRLGIEAAKLLAYVNTIDAIPTILSFLHWLHQSGEEDACTDYGPDIILGLGSAAAIPLLRHVVQPGGNESVKCTVVEGIKALGERDSSIQNTLTFLIIQGLSEENEFSPILNSDLMMLAIDWQLVDAAEAIERAFAGNRIDCGTAGDWNQVRKLLHVQGLGLPMPAEPFNSLKNFRQAIGVGAFSQDPLFMVGELQEDAAQKYLDTACHAFARSGEGKLLLAEDALAGHVYQFLDVGLHYLGKSVENMTAQDAKEILLEIFPRKVSLRADATDGVIKELVGFWRFCDRVHDIENARDIAAEIEKLGRRFREAMSDPANFGLAKGFFMAGQEAGFDMTTQAGLNAFMQIYNRSALSRLQRPTSNHIDRFDSSQVASTGSAAPAPKSLKERKKLLANRKNRK